MMLAFCGVHLFIGRLRWLDRTPRSRWLSFAGGVAVGYVFLHILPELGAHVSVFEQGTAFKADTAVAWLYSLSLGGLALFYGLERALEQSRTQFTGGAQDETPHEAVFWVHIGASCTLIAIVSYLLNHREDMSTSGLTLYFAAMTLHFVTADYGSRTHHPRLYDKRGRYVLVAATLGGWLTGLLVTLPEIVIGCLFAFVAGGIILLVLKEELPAERESAFAPFLAGALLYAGLVLAQAHLAE